MDSTIKCYYCDTSSSVFGDVIKHSIDKHENQTFQVKIESATEKFTRNFTIKPRDMHERGKVIIPYYDSFGFVYADCWFSHEAAQMYDY